MIVKKLDPGYEKMEKKKKTKKKKKKKKSTLNPKTEILLDSLDFLPFLTLYGGGGGGGEYILKIMSRINCILKMCPVDVYGVVSSLTSM